MASQGLSCSYEKNHSTATHNPHFIASKIGSYVKIVTATLNCFRGGISSARTPEVEERLARTTKSRAQAINELQNRVEGKLWSSRCKWEKIDDTDIDFPRLSENQIEDMCYGVYRINQTRTYAEAHLNENDGDFEIEVMRHSDTILRCKIGSRHKSSTEYFCCIEYSMDEVDSKEYDSDDELAEKFDEQLPIKSWYCQCSAGARTCGCCAHVATIIWYLGYARYNSCKSSLYRHWLRESIVQMET